MSHTTTVWRRANRNDFNQRRSPCVLASLGRGYDGAVVHFDFDRGPRQRDWPLDALDAKCSFYDKCERPDPGNVSEIHGPRDRRELAFFGQWRRPYSVPELASLQLPPELAGQLPSIDRTAVRDDNGHMI